MGNVALVRIRETLATQEETLALALGELCPAWRIDGSCSPVDPVDPSHWAAGTGSVQVTLRHRVTGRRKVLFTSVHRGVALSTIEAYGRGDAGPMRRYLEDIGVAEPAARDSGHFFHRPAVITSQGASSRLIVEKPKWSSLAMVTSRWRRATTRPALPVATAGSDVQEATGERTRGTLLSTLVKKLRRDLVLWQWRRTYERRHP